MRGRGGGEQNAKIAAEVAMAGDEEEGVAAAEVVLRRAEPHGSDGGGARVVRLALAKPKLRVVGTESLAGRPLLVWELAAHFLHPFDRLALAMTARAARSAFGPAARRGWRRAFEECGWPVQDEDLAATAAARRLAKQQVENAWHTLKAFAGPSFCWSLEPGASESAVARLETVLGTRLPWEVRYSMMLHDGQRASPSGSPIPRLLSVEEITTLVTIGPSAGATDAAGHRLLPLCEGWNLVDLETGEILASASAAGGFTSLHSASLSAFLAVG